MHKSNGSNTTAKVVNNQTEQGSSSQSLTESSQYKCVMVELEEIALEWQKGEKRPRPYRRLHTAEQDIVQSIYAKRVGLSHEMVANIINTPMRKLRLTDIEEIPAAIRLSEITDNYLGSFPYHLLNPKLGELIDLYSDELKKTNYNFLASTLLSAISTASSGRFTGYSKALAGHENGNDFNINLNTSLALVGESSMGKSPAMNVAFEPIKMLNSILYSRWKEEDNLWKDYQRESDKDKREEKRQALESRGILDQPIKGATIIKDYTLATIGQRLLGNKALNLALCSYQHEFTQFFQQIMRGGSERGSITAMNSLLDGEDYMEERMGREPVYIASPRFTFVAAIQPSFIGQVLSEEFKEVGYAGRNLFCSPQGLRYEAPELDKIDTGKIENISIRYRDSIHRIMAEVKTFPDGSHTIEAKPTRLLRFSDKAVKRNSEFNQDLTALCNRLYIGLDKDKASLIAKHQRIMPQIAVLLHISDRMYRLDFDNVVGEEIDEATIERAIAIDDYFRAELLMLMMESEKSAYEKLSQNHRKWYDAIGTATFKRAELYSTASTNPDTYGIDKNALTKLLKKEELFECPKHGFYQKGGGSGAIILGNKKRRLSSL